MKRTHPDGENVTQDELGEPLKDTNHRFDSPLLDPFRRQVINRNGVNHPPAAVRRWSLAEIQDVALFVAEEGKHAGGPSWRRLRRGPKTELQRWALPGRGRQRPQRWPLDFGKNVLLSQAFDNFTQGGERRCLKRFLELFSKLLTSLRLFVGCLTRLCAPFFEIGHCRVQLLFKILLHDALCLLDLALRCSVVNNAKQAVA